MWTHCGHTLHAQTDRASLISETLFTEVKPLLCVLFSGHVTSVFPCSHACGFGCFKLVK